MARASLAAAASTAGFRYSTLQLRRGAAAKAWLPPKASAECRVEQAALNHFEREGWRGYGGEGGLVLNLIKAMSFRPVPARHRSTYVEALYSGNVAFGSDRYEASELLGKVLSADEEVVATNYDFLASREPVYFEAEGMTFGPYRDCMLDFFPGLEKWMFLELFRAAGPQLLHRIAEIFAKDSYRYRRGWPDLTLWRGRELLFVEVKAPGDNLVDSQKVIAREIAQPLALDFLLLEVTAED
jgi:hypothetical protein